jgi:hypothetical protein
MLILTTTDLCLLSFCLLDYSFQAIFKGMTNILSRVLVNKTGFGLVIGFLDHLQVVTTVNYNTLRITVIITHKEHLHYPFPGDGFITQELYQPH